jgi:hypothetical protein
VEARAAATTSSRPAAPRVRASRPVSTARGASSFASREAMRRRSARSCR